MASRSSTRTGQRLIVWTTGRQRGGDTVIRTPDTDAPTVMATAREVRGAPVALMRGNRDGHPHNVESQRAGTRLTP